MFSAEGNKMTTRYCLSFVRRKKKYTVVAQRPRAFAGIQHQQLFNSDVNI